MIEPRAWLSVLFLAVVVLPATATPLFAPAVSYTTGGQPGYPYSLAAGDLNGDGKPDLVTANSFINTVSVLFGNGDGTFAPKTDFVVGSYPTRAVIADLNSDGKQDLVVAFGNSDHLSILVGDGVGGFGPATPVPTGLYPSAVVPQDVSGDGEVDLVVAHDYPPAISVAIGHGDGTFEPFVDNEGFSPYGLAVGDLNGDGQPDVAATDLLSHGMSVFLNAGGGTYARTDTYRVPSSPYADAVGDLDDDGELDIVVATNIANSVSVFLGNGDGTFGPPGCTPLDGDCSSEYVAGNDPVSVAVADLDGDGKADLAVADQGSDSVSVLPGNGDGTFQVPIRHSVGSFPVSVVIHDLNGDGRRDLAVANYFSSSVSVLLNITTVGVQPGVTPARFALSPVGPNPFRSTARFELEIPATAPVRLEVCDLAGRRVRTLENSVLPPGRYRRAWDGAADDGSAAAAGMYFVRFSAPGIESIRRAILVR